MPTTTHRPVVAVLCPRADQGEAEVVEGRGGGTASSGNPGSEPEGRGTEGGGPQRSAPVNARPNDREPVGARLDDPGSVSARLDDRGSVRARLDDRAFGAAGEGGSGGGRSESGGSVGGRSDNRAGGAGSSGSTDSEPGGRGSDGGGSEGRRRGSAVGGELPRSEAEGRAYGLNVPSGLDNLGVEFRYCAADRLAEAVRGAHGVLLWDYFSTALRDVWPLAGSVEWIHVTAAGVDTLLFDELRDSDVVVTNARGIFDRPIAEYVLGAVIAHAKDSRTSFSLQREHRWQHRETRSVTGARALVVGTGGIGREIARLLRAAGLEVRGAGRTPREDDPDFEKVVASSNLPDEAGWCDHLIIAAPLTDSTRGLVDATVLAAMKPDAHLVNIARGPIVDEKALNNALVDHRIGGATLDVFEQEPLPPDHPLWDAPNVTITAHLSGDVVGWREALAAQYADNVRRWIVGAPLLNVVDKKLGYVPGGAAR